MGDLLSKFDGGELIGLTVVVGGLVIAAISIITHQWRRVRVAEVEAALKQHMLEKGLSAAEIERVVKASARRPDAEEEEQSPSHRREKLVARMVKRGMSPEEIARVCRAMEGLADPPGQAKGLADPKT